MASGFIFITEELCFAPRWSVYDFVLKTIVEELKSPELKTIVESYYPPRYLEDDLDMGWGFIDERINDTTCRSLDLYRLNTKHIDLFWTAIASIIERNTNEPTSELRDHQLFYFNQLYGLKDLESEEIQLKITSQNRDCYYNKKDEKPKNLKQKKSNN